MSEPSWLLQRGRITALREEIGVSMSLTDSRGLALSTSSAPAAQEYRSGVDLLLSLWPGATQTLQHAVDLDPEFALAHAALARQYAIHAQLPQAKVAIARAKVLASQRGTEREVSHVEVLSLAIHGQTQRALSAALEHIDRWPQDALIFGLPLGAFGLFAFSGMSDHDRARVELCERYARHFSQADWWFLTYRGWSHTENGQLAFGRSLTERALEQRRENANAAHAFTHVLHESGATGEVRSFVENWLPGYDPLAVLHGHIAWHGALAALEQDDPISAIDWYERHVAPSVSAGTPVNIISDSASLLWRLQAYGYAVPQGSWQQAAEYASRYFQQAGFPFVDLHMAMIAAANGDDASVVNRVATLEHLVSENTLPTGAVAPTLCRAMHAFVQGQYGACVQMLERFGEDVVRIGGSGAQREVVEDTLVLSLMRLKKDNEAASLLSERLLRRPSARDEKWLKELAARMR